MLAKSSRDIGTRNCRLDENARQVRCMIGIVIESWVMSMMMVLVVVCRFLRSFSRLEGND